MSNRHIGIRNGRMRQDNTVAHLGALGGERVYIVNTQEDFEQLFGSSYGAYKFNNESSNPVATVLSGSACMIPSNTTIILNPIQGTTGDSLTASGAGIGDDGTNTFNGRPAYVLKNAIQVGDRVSIFGHNFEDTIVIKNDADNTNEDLLKFYTEEKGSSAVSVASGATFTVADSSSFEVGDYVIHDNDYETYKVTSVPGGTSVIVDRAITGASSGTLWTTTTGLTFEGWTFDGRGGVSGLGGSIYGYMKNGGAFELTGCSHSVLNCQFINHRVTLDAPAVGGHGGAIYGVKSTKITAHHIVSCFANRLGGSDASYGGAVSNVHDSSFIAEYCYSLHYGGAFYNCDRCTLVAKNCASTHASPNNAVGGAGHSCSDCISFIAINCTIGTFGSANAFASCSGNLKAEGCYNGWSVVTSCGYSNIELLNCNASASSGPGTNLVVTSDHSTIKIRNSDTLLTAGYGVYDCDYCDIVMEDCSIVQGAAIGSCSYCKAEIVKCFGGSNGGAAHTCLYSDITAVNCSCDASGGAAYACDYCTIKATNCTGTAGGAAHSCDHCTIIATDCYASGASGHGGGANNCDYCDITITRGRCTGSGGVGGGIYQCNYGNAHLTECYTANGNGGGAYQCTDSYIEATRCYVGSSGNNGGGVWGSSFCVIKVDNCYISTGTGHGGGTYNCADSVIEAVRCYTAGGNGGGVYGADRSVIRAVKCYTTGAGHGGGAYLSSNSDITCLYCYTSGTGTGGGCRQCAQSRIHVNGCYATDGHGGGCYDCTRCTITASQCSANGASKGGGGVAASTYIKPVGLWYNNSANLAGTNNIYASLGTYYHQGRDMIYGSGATWYYGDTGTGTPVTWGSGDR